MPPAKLVPMSVAGPIIIVLVVVVVLPALFWVAYGIAGFLAATLLPRRAELDHPGSELIDTNY